MKRQKYELLYYYKVLNTYENVTHATSDPRYYFF